MFFEASAQIDFAARSSAGVYAKQISCMRNTAKAMNTDLSILTFPSI